MQPVVIGDVIWEPSDEVVAKSRLKRFMDRHDIATFAELLHRADADIEWFWDAAIKDIDIAFYRHYDRVVDLSKGKQWATWWRGARMNIVHSCLDRHRDEEFHDKTALIWEGEPGEVRKMTYGELHAEVCRLAGALRRLGIRPGDRVGIFMPMCPEVAVSVLAVAKIGAVFISLFSGYGPAALATRLEDGEAKCLICADGFYRRGQVVDRKSTRLNSSHVSISYAVFCLKKKKTRGPSAQVKPHQQLANTHPIDFLSRLNPYASAKGAAFLPFGLRFRMIFPMHSSSNEVC